MTASSGARHLRLVSWNIENLAPALGRSARKARAPHLIEMMQQFGWPDALCLQEVRIRPEDQADVACMVDALPGYACHHALASDPRNAGFRGGRAYGVVSYLRRELAPQLLPRPAWDREGRVLAVAVPSAELVLINVYAVNGTERPHFDHEPGCSSGDRHAFKRRFQADLISYARSLQQDQGLVLIGDWNVSRTALDTWPRLRTEPPHALARAMFNQTLMPALDVVDVFRELHPELRAYTWFNPRAAPGRLDAARVDFALISRSLLARVCSATILDDPTQRFYSDHAPVELVLGRG